MEDKSKKKKKKKEEKNKKARPEVRQHKQNCQIGICAAAKRPFVLIGKSKGRAGEECDTSSPALPLDPQNQHLNIPKKQYKMCRKPTHVYLHRAVFKISSQSMSHSHPVLRCHIDSGHSVSISFVHNLRVAGIRKGGTQTRMKRMITSGHIALRRKTSKPGGGRKRGGNGATSEKCSIVRSHFRSE